MREKIREKLEDSPIQLTPEERSALKQGKVPKSILDKLGIAVRTGHHCAQPIMDFYKIPGTIRASFAFYNTKEEIDVLVEGVKKAKMMLS